MIDGLFLFVARVYFSQLIPSNKTTLRSEDYSLLPCVKLGGGEGGGVVGKFGEFFWGRVYCNPMFLH